jgi:uncharacterized protein
VADRSRGPPSAEGEGDAAVRLARRTLEELLPAAPPRDPAERYRAVPLPAGLEARRGAFVTLLRHPSEELRGCIGFAEPIFPLRAAIPRAAYAAATEDPRFPVLAPRELSRTVVEVSLLTAPRALDGGAPSTYPGELRVGRDGLIVQGHGASGLLLPQVAVEQGWDAVGLLDGTCAKAGLPRGAWRDPGVRVLRFSAEVYREAHPRGAVVARPR